jgi:hypothetical protein
VILKLVDLSPEEKREQHEEAFKIIKEDIWPIYEKLLESDQENMANNMDPNQQSNPSQSQQNQQGQQGQQSQQSGSSQQDQQAGEGDETQENQQSGSPEEQQQTGEGDKTEENQQSGSSQGEKTEEGEEADENQQSGSSQGEKTEEGEEADENQQSQSSQGEKTEEGEEADENQQSQSSQSEKTEEGKEGEEGNENQEGQQNQQSDSSQKQQDPKNKELQDKAKKILEDYAREMTNKKLADKSTVQPPPDAGRYNQSQEFQNDPENNPNNSDRFDDLDLPSVEDILNQRRNNMEYLDSRRTEYDKINRSTIEQSRKLAEELKSFMHERERPRYVTGYNSGNKLDLRRAMQAEAKYEKTGKFDNDIWMKRTNPTKIGHKFVFVLDESGSMRDGSAGGSGRKWDSALKGLVLSQEALNSMKIDFGVVGFSDTPHMVKSIDDDWNDKAREKSLNEIQESPVGGTNDVDALRMAMDMLGLAQTDETRTVIVITDGEGRVDDMKSLLKEAEKEKINVIGVGIGDGMRAVESVYDSHCKVKRVQDLPIELAKILRKEIQGSYS